MADHSGSAHFQILFESALQAYEKTAGVTLAQHPLALQIQSCQSVDDINTLLQNQAQAITDLQASNRIMKSVKKILSILVPLSTAATLTVPLVNQKTLVVDFASLTVSCQSSDPAKAIHASLAILLDVRAVPQFLCTHLCDFRMNQAAKGVISSHDALVDLLESIEQFVSRLDVYTRIPFTNPMVEIVIKIMMELLSILALATKELKQRKLGE
jgi:hypothetical protein